MRQVFCSLSAVVLVLTLAAAIPPAKAQAPPAPAVLFIDVTTGPVRGGPNDLGAPITLYGTGFGATQGTSTVTIGGVAVARVLVWGTRNAHNPLLDKIVVQPGPAVSGGPIVVTVAGRSSNADWRFQANAGQVYAISPAGNDGQACSLAAPCATVSHVAGTVMAPGDVLLVRAGTYPESEIWLRGDQGDSGTASQPKFIVAYPGEAVTFNNGARPFIVDADHITVAGFTFSNGKSLGIAGWARRDQTGARLIDNVFLGQIGYEAIGSHGDGHLIAGNVCDISGSTVGTQGHCYYISYGDGVRVMYNIARGATGYGLHVFDQKRATNDFQRVIRNLVVEGNLLQGSRERSGMILAMNDEGGLGNRIEGVIVRNNLFVGNNHAGLQIQSIASEVDVVHNTFYRNGVLGVYLGSGSLSGVRLSNNLIDQTANSACRVFCDWYQRAHLQSLAPAGAVSVDHNVYTGIATALVGASDPGALSGPVTFANPALLDFHLLAGSTGIDGGRPLALAPTDFDGHVRPYGPLPDPGAYEYGASVSTLPARPVYVPTVLHRWNHLGRR